MLVQTHNFEADLRRVVNLHMNNRIFKLEFEVRSNDPMITELSNYGFINSVRSVFKIVVLIFLLILALILFRHYKEKPDDIQYYVTDIEKSRFG